MTEPLIWHNSRAKLKDLTPYAKNPRELTKDQHAQLVRSLKKFGLAEVPAIDTDNTIAAGHMRIKVLMELNGGDFEIDVRKPNRKLTDDEFDEYLVRSNKNSGEWDFDKLNSDFKFDDLLDWGFNEDELGGPKVEEVPAMCDEDEVPELKPDPITRLGDVWILGDHRVACGDSTSIDAVEKLMDGHKADMVFTDPPYNISFKPLRGKHDKIKNDDMCEEDFNEFLYSVFANCKAIMNPDTYLISFMGWSTTHNFRQALKDLFEIKSMPIWKKNNFGIGYYTRPQYEPFYLCLNGKPIKPAKAPSDVFEFNKVHKTIHSCEKPVDMLVGISNIFNKNGLFYEPFGGSGSMLIACEKSNRKCYTMELDEKYCDVIVERWQKHSGDKAILESTGEEFDALLKNKR